MINLNTSINFPIKKTHLVDYPNDEINFFSALIVLMNIIKVNKNIIFTLDGILISIDEPEFILDSISSLVELLINEYFPIHYLEHKHSWFIDFRHHRSDLERFISKLPIDIDDICDWRNI